MSNPTEFIDCGYPKNPKKATKVIPGLMRRLAIDTILNPMSRGGIGQRAKAPKQFRKVIEATLPELRYFNGVWEQRYDEISYTGSVQAGNIGNVTIATYLVMQVGGAFSLHLRSLYEGPDQEKIQLHLNTLNLEIRGRLSNLAAMTIEWQRRLQLFRSLVQYYEQFDPLQRIPDPSLRSEEWENPTPFPDIRKQLDDILSPVRGTGHMFPLFHLQNSKETSTDWQAMLNWNFEKEWSHYSKKGILNGLEIRITIGRTWPADDRWVQVDIDFPKEAPLEIANLLKRMCGKTPLIAGCAYPLAVVALAQDLDYFGGLLKKYYGIFCW